MGMKRALVFGAIAIVLSLNNTGPGLYGIVTMMPGLISAGVKMLSLDLITFEKEHREMYAQAEIDGNYSGVTIHYYSVMGDFLQTVIGDYWHWVPHKKGVSHDQTFDDFNRRVSVELKLSPKQTLCEIGCGLCRTGRDIAHKAGAKFIGITMSPREVVLGRRELEEAGAAEWAKIIQGDYKNMPLADGECDALFAIYTLKYSKPVETLNKAFKEISRVLRVGGRFGSYEILKSSTYDDKNASHKEWTDRISYHTGMPPLSSVHNFREEPPKFGLDLVSEDNLEDHPDTAPNYKAYPFSVADPPDVYLKLLNFAEDVGVKVGFRSFAENFLEHPVVDFLASMKAGVITTGTLFIYEKGK